jgi:peptidoglycan hydrolase-like amidase/tetratricopeptide (TPR) repeat protein
MVLASLCLSPLSAWGNGSSALSEDYSAEIAFYRGNLKQAQDEYERYISRNPDDQAMAMNLAAVLLERGEGRDAARVLERANVHGHELGEAYLAAGEFDRAAKELTIALGQPGSHWRSRILLGLIAASQNRHPEAVEFYWRALNEEKNQPAVHLMMARSLAALSLESPDSGEYFKQRAREEYKRALKIDWSLWQVHWDLAKFYEVENRWAQAAREWNEVRVVLSNAPEIEAAMKRAQHMIGTAPAVATVEAALTVAPTATAVPTPVRPPTPEVEVRLPAIMFKDIRIKPLGRPKDPLVQVGLGEKMKAIGFGCSGNWIAKDHQGKRFWEGVAGKGYRIKPDAKGRWVLKSWDGKTLKPLPRLITLEPINPDHVLGVVNLFQSTGYFWGGGTRATRYYRGKLVVLRQSQGLRLNNVLPMEDYLASVVPAEMPAEWPMEALKAQAVVARTDSLRRHGTHWKQGFDVCNTPHCAEYAGVHSEDPRALEALSATAGQLLYRGSHLAPAFYSHACGGVTQDVADAWGGGKDIFAESCGIYDEPGNTVTCIRLPFPPRVIRAWIGSQPDVLCADPKYSGIASFRWVKIFSQDELKTMLNPRFHLGTIQKLEVLERSRSGYVRSLRISGNNGSITLQGDRVRTHLGGLRSNLFMILAIPEERGGYPVRWVFWGAGWGHGVGFCQAGSAAMADKGYAYQEILQHYFPGSELR